MAEAMGNVTNMADKSYVTGMNITGIKEIQAFVISPGGHLGQENHSPLRFVGKDKFFVSVNGTVPYYEGHLGTWKQGTFGTPVHQMRE